MKKIKNISLQITSSNWQKMVRYAQRNGVRSLSRKLKEKLLYFLQNENISYFNPTNYKSWILNNEPSSDELIKQSQEKFSINPKISIVVPTFNTPQMFLEQMVDSVLNQTYSNWELCIADGSENDSVKNYIEKISQKESRIKFVSLENNLGIAGNTNMGIDLATGDFIALLDHDDTLSAFAIYEVVKSINENPKVEMLYSDEDKLTYNGKRRINPHFKPDWSPDTILGYNYVTHLLVIKTDLLHKVGKIRSGFEGSQDHDLVLRVSEQAKQIVHIPKILYHWREHQNSTSSNVESKSYVTFSTQKAVSQALERRGIEGRVFGGPFFASARVVYHLKNKPLISIIIPTKDHVETLRTCINSIINRTTYTNYEIIITDTQSKEQKTLDYYKELKKDSRIKILNWNKAFNFSAVNNFAVKHAKGEYFLFLNNDTEILTAEWIESMLEFCQRDDVGAVGAKLFYPDYTIQHGGVILGIGGVAGHSHKSFSRNCHGYHGRLSIPNNYSAVTAACVMVSRKVFQLVNEFDENYALAFNDVDLCLKIREKGLLIVWTPYAQLLHYESKTRGYEDTPEKQLRFKGEIDRFYSRWQKILDQGDPYYNPNLTLKEENFSIKDKKI